MFAPGRNIAIKCPRAQFAPLAAFYRDTIGLTVRSESEASVSFEFGAMRLWVDRVDAMTQPEVWLELHTPDTAAAAEHLAIRGVIRCDEVEPLPAGFDGFWIAAPGGLVHLVAEPGQ